MNALSGLVERCEPRFVKKVKKMVDLCVRDKKQNDALIVIEGREGTGKTNASQITAAIFKWHVQRPVYMFFDLDKLINLAQNTTSLILIWDEPALDSLTTDQLNSLNKNLMKLLMMCRVNRHFFIFNITDFTKFSKYITIERPVAFVHLQKLRTGHGCYIRYKRLEALHQDWQDKHRRRYNKYKSFYLDFPLMSEAEWLELDMNINGVAHASMSEYTVQKRLALSSIGSKSNGKDKLKQEVRRLKKLIATEPKGLKSVEERAVHYKINERQLQRWAHLDLNKDSDDELGEGSVFEGGDDANNIKIREEEEGDGSSASKQRV